jgi:hypothetical protein
LFTHHSSGSASVQPRQRERAHAVHDQPERHGEHRDDDRIEQESPERHPVEDGGVIVERDVADRQEGVDAGQVTEDLGIGLQRRHDHEHQRQSEHEHQQYPDDVLPDEARPAAVRALGAMGRGFDLGRVGERPAGDLLARLLGRPFRCPAHFFTSLSRVR